MYDYNQILLCKDTSSELDSISPIRLDSSKPLSMTARPEEHYTFLNDRRRDNTLVNSQPDHYRRIRIHHRL